VVATEAGELPGGPPGGPVDEVEVEGEAVIVGAADSGVAVAVVVVPSAGSDIVDGTTSCAIRPTTATSSRAPQAAAATATATAVTTRAVRP
jgi:hypothetical protein